MTDYSDPWWGHISGKCIDDCPWCHINELQAELAALKEAAQAEVDRQRHQCGILRQELQPTTAALASLLQERGEAIPE